MMEIDWLWTMVVAAVCGSAVWAADHWELLSDQPRWKRAIAIGLAVALIVAALQLFKS